MKHCRVRIELGLLLVLLLARSICAQSPTPSPNEKKTISITWLGHAAFEIMSPGGTDLLIDPFLTKNPATPAERKDLSHYHPRQIFAFRRRRRIFSQKRIDQKVRPAGRHDLESGVAEPGDRNSLFLVRRRRWRLRAD